MDGETRKPIILGAVVVILVAGIITYFVGQNAKKATSLPPTVVPTSIPSFPTTTPSPTTPPSVTDLFSRTVYAVLNQEVHFTLVTTAGNAPIQWSATVDNPSALEQVINSPYQVAYIGRKRGTWVITATGVPTCLPNCRYHVTKHAITVVIQ